MLVALYESCLIRDAALPALLAAEAADQADQRHVRTFTSPMELIHSFSEAVEIDGRKFRAKIFGEEQWDGCWHGFVAFFQKGKRGSMPVATDLDCVQPNKTALAWWAGGLTTEYLATALKRATFLETHPEERTDGPRVTR